MLNMAHNRNYLGARQQVKYCEGGETCPGKFMASSLCKQSRGLLRNTGYDVILV